MAVLDICSTHIVAFIWLPSYKQLLEHMTVMALDSTHIVLLIRLPSCRPLVGGHHLPVLA